MTRSLSVLIVHNAYTTQGGEEKAVELQRRLLEERGHRVSCYTEDSGAFSGRTIFAKIIGALSMPFSFKHYRGLCAAIRSINPDIVHIHNVFPLLTPSVYFAAKAEGKPVVQSLHNYRLLCSNGLFLLPDGTRCERCKRGAHWNAVRFGCYAGSRLRTLGMASTLLLHRWLATFTRCVDVFLAPSQFLKNKLVEGGFPENKIVYLPMGIPPLSAPIQTAAAPVVLFVGRLSREKGLPVLLEAAASRPEWTFHIVGDGPLKTDLESRIAKSALQNVRLLGRLSGTPLERAYQEAALLVLPSECYENLPTVILEAWFYGVPVVVSNVGGMAEIVKEGEFGFQFPVGDAAALSALLGRLSVEKTAQMRSAIRAHFVAQWMPERFVRALESLYEKVLLKPSQFL